MFVFLPLIILKHYVMTNFQFFKSMEFQFFNLNTKTRLSVYFSPVQDNNFPYQIFYADRSILSGTIYSRQRGFDVDLRYNRDEDCVFSPDELKRWVPTAFKHYGNYFQWLNFLAIDIEFIIKKNPQILLPF